MRWLMLLLLLAACDRGEKSVPPATPQVEPWIALGAKFDAAIKPGFTQQQVLDAIGEPTERKTILSGDIAEVWHYEVGPHIYYKVRFNQRNRVINSQLDSENRIGG
jgi:outer membrane protein assembly factor BamE (lipoprotein component of BamABCDE complex)